MTGANGIVLRLPIVGATTRGTPDRATCANVTPLRGGARAGRPTWPLEAAPAESDRADEGDSDAVLALLRARRGYQAATEATARVRLPSLTDFLG